MVLAANRDERLDRAWDPPAAWWPDQPGVVAGRDRTAGGTWMGLNRHGVAAAVLNRQGSLGPGAGQAQPRRTAVARAGASRRPRPPPQAIVALDAGQWRSFNLVLADAAGAVFLRGLGHGRPQAQRLAPGLHMVTAHDPDDPDSPRVARHLPRFAAAPAPDPVGAGRPGRICWPTGQGEPAEQLNVVPRGGFGTVCSSLAGAAGGGAADLAVRRRPAACHPVRSGASGNRPLTGGHCPVPPPAPAGVAAAAPVPAALSRRPARDPLAVCPAASPGRGGMRQALLYPQRRPLLARRRIASPAPRGDRQGEQ